MTDEQKTEQGKPSSTSAGIDKLVDRMEARRERIADEYEAKQLRGQIGRASCRERV